MGTCSSSQSFSDHLAFFTSARPVQVISDRSMTASSTDRSPRFPITYPVSIRYLLILFASCGNSDANYAYLVENSGLFVPQME